MSIKLNESGQFVTEANESVNMEALEEASKIMADLGVIVEKAFKGAGFNFEWEFGAPSRTPRVGREGNPFVDDLWATVTIGNIVFRFKCSMHNAFANRFYKTADVDWSANGYVGNKLYQFTTKDAQDVLTATKLAEQLKETCAKEINDFLDMVNNTEE